MSEIIFVPLLTTLSIGAFVLVLIRPDWRKIMHKFKFFKCQLCGRRKGKIERIIRFEFYSDTYYYFHPECVEKVINEPENYGSQAADIALKISEALAEEKRRAEEEKHNQISRIENSLVKKYILYDRFLDRLGIDIREAMKEGVQKNE